MTKDTHIDENVPSESFTLEKDIQLVTSKLFSDADLHLNGFRSEVRYSLEQMAQEVMFATVLPSEYLDEFIADCSYQVPLSTWQLIKITYAPTWFTKRYPIRHKTVKRDVVVECKAVYPKLPEKFVGTDYKLSYTYRVV